MPASGTPSRVPLHASLGTSHALTGTFASGARYGRILERSGKSSLARVARAQFVFAMIVLIAGVLVLAASALATTTTRPPPVSHILVTGEQVSAPSGTATPQRQLVGQQLIQTPRWPRRYHEDGLRTADFIVRQSASCVAYVQASVGAEVVFAGTTPTALADAAVRYRRRMIAEGMRAHGAWALAEMHTTQTQLVAAHPEVRRLLAYAVFTVASHAVIEVTTLADFVGTCSDAVVRSGGVAHALTTLSRTTRFAGHLATTSR